LRFFCGKSNTYLGRYLRVKEENINTHDVWVKRKLHVRVKEEDVHASEGRRYEDAHTHVVRMKEHDTNANEGTRHKCE